MESVPLSQPAPSHATTSTSQRINSFRTRNGGIDVPMQTREIEEIPDNRSVGLGDRAERGEPQGRRNFTSILSPEPSQRSRRYVPIDLQPIATESRWGQDQGESNLSPQDQEGQRNELARPERSGRSWLSLLKERRTRRKLATLVISTIFLIVVIAVYLTLTVSDTNLGQELHILLIFMVLILAIVFCHSLIRFFMSIMRARNTPTGRNRVPSIAGPSGYAQPSSPIHVVLAGDEEAMTEGNAIREKVTAPPPAYGLWRSSVRMNPDLLYWQRVEESRRGNQRSLSQKATLPRPPSYTSDDGIDYVIEAQPRSFAPDNHPEPQHSRA